MATKNKPCPGGRLKSGGRGKGLGRGGGKGPIGVPKPQSRFIIRIVKWQLNSKTWFVMRARYFLEHLNSTQGIVLGYRE